MKNSYDAIAIINIGKLLNNLKIIKQLAKKSMVYAVVKADAYGHGNELASYIENYVDGFAVAKAAEGVALRFLGIKKPILLLLPITQNQIKTAINYELSICCHSLESAKQLSSFSEIERLEINMKIDSGMNRLGFNSTKDFVTALKILSAKSNITLNSVYSHFANAESLTACEKQFNVFKEFEKVFKSYSGGFSHISASGGLLQRKFNLDAVRVGILMYGYKPFACELELEPIMKIIAPTIKSFVAKNDCNCLYNVPVQKGKYSLFAYGYADGLFRKFFINRCMNLSMQKSFRDDYTVIMDDADKLAKENNTISYEVLCRCASNLEKKYIGYL